MLSFRLNLVFNGPIFFEPLICGGLMIFLLLISRPVLCNASFTKTSRSPHAGHGWDVDGKVGHVGDWFSLQALGDKLRREWWIVTYRWKRLNLLALKLGQKAEGDAVSAVWYFKRLLQNDFWKKHANFKKKTLWDFHAFSDELYLFLEWEHVNISLLFYVLPHRPVQTNQCSPATYLYLVTKRSRRLQHYTSFTIWLEF